MATTGAELFRYTQGLYDKDYSDYVSNAKANRIFKAATYNVIERKASAPLDQKSEDELSFLTVKGQVVNPVNNNRISKLSIVITSVLVAGPLLVVTTATPHNYNTGDIVWIKSLNGLTVFVDSQNTVTYISPTQFSFLNPGVGSAYTSGGYTYSQNQLVDYMRLLALQVDIRDAKLQGVYVSGASNATPLVLTLNRKSLIRTGDKIIVAGVNGSNTNANGTFWVDQLSNTRYALYSDESLETPIAGNGTYATSTNSSSVRMIYSNYCVPYASDDKISAFGQPVVYDPAFEDTQQAIVLYPSNATVLSATIDYIKKPDILIDVTNDLIDLELIFGSKLLYSIANEFCNLFAMSVKDDTLYKESENEMIQNP